MAVSDTSTVGLSEQPVASGVGGPVRESIENRTITEGPKEPAPLPLREDEGSTDISTSDSEPESPERSPARPDEANVEVQQGPGLSKSPAPQKPSEAIDMTTARSSVSGDSIDQNYSPEPEIASPSAPEEYEPPEPEMSGSSYSPSEEHEEAHDTNADGQLQAYQPLTEAGQVLEAQEVPKADNENVGMKTIYLNAFASMNWLINL